jgi:4-hydroxy-4-methyl-2-oxoglutarate aldolase
MGDATVYRMSGDAGLGLYDPPDIRSPAFARVPEQVLDELRAMTGLVATVSDVLEELGWQLSVPASVLAPRHERDQVAVGHALTLRYLPVRKQLSHVTEGGTKPPRLAHHVVYRLASVGDIMIVDASATQFVSVMGGLAAQEAVDLGLSAVLIDGGVRDLDQVHGSGLRLWTRYVTPRSGKFRVEAISVNAPVTCGGVQVNPGDLVIADATGACFVPPEAMEAVLGRVREVVEEENVILGERS